MPDGCQISLQGYYYCNSGPIYLFQASFVIFTKHGFTPHDFKILKLLVSSFQRKGHVTSSCLQKWRMTLKALSSRVQYKYRNQPRWMNRWLWSFFDHLILNSSHASTGDDSAIIALEWETARVKTARDHYSYCIISESGQSSYSSVSVLMKATADNWQPCQMAEFTSRNTGC